MTISRPRRREKKLRREEEKGTEKGLDKEEN